MRTRRKQALKILGISLPILGCGLYIFNPEGIANRFVEVLAILALIFGAFGWISGLIMFFTKNSLGLIETKPKEEEPNDSWRKDTVWEKEEPVQEEEPKLKMPS